MRRFTILPILLLAVCLVTPAGAGESPPFTARAGLSLARDAARAWADDARLVYVENDELVNPTGGAERWAYLFYSHARGMARGYSIRDGAILEASDLGFDFDAPPLPDAWIDSGEAFRVAENKAGRSFRNEHGGRLGTMLLVRGAFHNENPNASTWTLVYTSDTEPALFVVVDAAAGKVVKTWRG